MSIPDDFKNVIELRSSKEPKDERPLAYLWVFDPQDGKVYLEDERGTHPAHFPLHRTMATHVTHPDRLEGYAFSIIGGWRITDADHTQVDDPFILRRVRQALRKEHPPPPLPNIRYHGDPIRHLHKDDDER